MTSFLFLCTNNIRDFNIIFSLAKFLLSRVQCRVKQQKIEEDCTGTACFFLFFHIALKT
jgi:hypothetical protein